MGKAKDRKRKKKAKGPTLAERADKYDLYQRAVQEPECEVEFFDKVYKARHGRKPKTLREDFCGTFAVSCVWAGKKGRTATAVDLDPEPLAWGREHNLAALTPKARERVRVVQDDVRTVDDETFDIVAAQNFSYWIFKTRDELREYFRIARENLAEGGVLVLDLMGGGDCYHEDDPDERKLKGFVYEWKLVSFDPITHEATHHIAFRFKDGSRLDEAFTYNWRFWTIPEIRELLEQAGYSQSTVYWELEDDDGEGAGEWEPAEQGTCDPSWIAYIVADR